MTKPHDSVIKLIASVVAALLFIVVSAYFYVESRRRPYEVPTTVGWQTGDIFFSVGNSWKSEFVRLSGGNADEISHCGIVLRSGDKVVLVHMSTDKGHIVGESPDDYGKINNASKVIVRHLTNPVDTISLKKRLECLLSSGKPFDYKFDKTDTAEYYCSELVVDLMFADSTREYKSLMRHDYIYPQDIYNILNF